MILSYLTHKINTLFGKINIGTSDALPVKLDSYWLFDGYVTGQISCTFLSGLIPGLFSV